MIFTVSICDLEYTFSKDKSKEVYRHYKNNVQQKVIFYYNLSGMKIIWDKVFKRMIQAKFVEDSF